MFAAFFASPIIAAIMAILAPFKKPLMIIGGGAIVLFATYEYGHVKGKMEERAKCNAAALAAQLRQANIDKQIAERTAANVQLQLNDFTINIIPALEKKVNEYEKQISSKPAKVACVFDDADVRGMLNVGPRNAKKSRAKRAN